MKHNYPIKYAVMPIKDKERRDDDWHDICYVIVKCYVLEERKHHKLDGENYTNYFVVCPYHYDQTYFHWVKSPPDDYYGEWVRHVYDTYEEALDEKELKNAEVEPFYIFDSEKQKKHMQLFNDQVELFKQFEKDVESGTKELKVNGKPKEQTIITMSLSDNKLTMRDLSFYDAVEGSHYNRQGINPFMAYTVSSRTFKKLKGMESLTDIDIKKVTKTPLLMNSKDNKYMKLISPEGDASYLKLVMNNDCFWRRKEAEFIEPKIENYIFTLEDYDDIVNAYGVHMPKQELSYSKGRSLILERFYNS